MALPSRFIDQAKPQDMYDEAQLNAPHIVRTVLAALGRDHAGTSLKA